MIQQLLGGSSFVLCFLLVRPSVSGESSVVGMSRCVLMVPGQVALVGEPVHIMVECVDNRFTSKRQFGIIEGKEEEK